MGQRGNVFRRNSFVPGKILISGLWLSQQRGPPDMVDTVNANIAVLDDEHQVFASGDVVQ